MKQIQELYQKWQSMQPLSSEDEERLRRKFMLDFNFNSNHIEGNILTYGQTEVLLLLGEVVGPAKMKDLEEMKAHNVCLKMMEAEALGDHPLTEGFIRNLQHTMLREDYEMFRQLPGGIQTGYVARAGCYKTRPNSVITPTGECFDYASPEETPAFMHDLVAWYNLVADTDEYSPIELASLFHYRYIRIHPFEDGNGRIARLLMNFILLRKRYPMIVVRSSNKHTYLNALREADARVGSFPSDGANATREHIKPFTTYLEKLLAGELMQNIAFVEGNASRIWWYNGELISFRSLRTPRLLQILADNPRVTNAELSSLLGINTSAVQKQLATLSGKGYIVKESNPKRWRVIALPTTSKGGNTNEGGQTNTVEK
ncbi:HTH domain protein [Bacteroides pyogenes F0041]|uniref:HTH domain protein n=1 Tax=Bacteroides pyogenes F0041 TaxID=1321819 RepID=U2C674_9BACE|nr:Fic family protein [Bacteroides pyogenes]ERI85994.1 HTH domain protein [Bacteroides pyogenes F0041]